MNALQKLRQLADSIAANADPLQTQKDWELVERLLARTGADPAAIDDAVKTRDPAKLDAIVRSLEHPAPAAEPSASPAADPGRFSHDDKAAALRAFKKRLRVMRLSDESKLGSPYTSGGKRSNIDAIEPPSGFDPEIWRALVAEGRLVDTGQGFYALPG